MPHMFRLAALLLWLPLAASAASFPRYASLPRLPLANDTVEVESFGQAEFSTRERPEVHRGRTWLGYLVYEKKFGDDARKALGAILAEMEKGGWQVMYRDEPRNPPLATLKREKDGRVSWASVEMFEQARVAILEVGPPRTKLKLEPPAAGIDGVPQDADFPFLKRFPGAKLIATKAEARPMLVEMEGARQPAQVAPGTVVKEYEAPEGTGKLEIAVVYRDAMRAAGWRVVDEDFRVATGDPHFTAHYAKGGLDLWAFVRATGNEYSVAVGVRTSRAPGGRSPRSR